MGGLDMPFEDIKGSLSNWVTTKSIQLEIKRRFRGFLEAYKDDADELIYRKRVKDMCIGGDTDHGKLAATKATYNLMSIPCQCSRAAAVLVIFFC